MSDEELDDAAALMMKRFGDDAPIESGKRADCTTFPTTSAPAVASMKLANATK